MLGGFAVPAVALTLGWRVAFVPAACLVAPVALLLPRPTVSVAARRLLAAAGAAAAVVGRVTLGARADRQGAPHLRVVVSMLGAGGVAYVLLAIGSRNGEQAAFAIGTILAFGAGWGWNGLFTFAVVHNYPDAPARASSVIQVGGRLAGIGGPFGFGFLATHYSYAAAWSVDGGAVFLAGVVMTWGSRLLLRRLQLAPDTTGQGATPQTKCLSVG